MTKDDRDHRLYQILTIKERTMDDKDVLMDALKFHGHKCWASVAGVRVGLAALRTLAVNRSGGTQLFGIVEIGEDHGGMCFGDGVQYTTGCTFGKGNIRKEPYGKLAFTLIEKATNRSIRVSYKPTLQKQIGESAFMRKRGMGVMPDDIPLEEQMELVNLVWDAPEADVLTIGDVVVRKDAWFPEIMGFTPCAGCGELTAHAYLRVVGTKQVCIPCSGYER
jgi:formylmethanofuran dehydrogenase subunit E